MTRACMHGKCGRAGVCRSERSGIPCSLPSATGGLLRHSPLPRTLVQRGTVFTTEALAQGWE